MKLFSKILVCVAAVSCFSTDAFPQVECVMPDGIPPASALGGGSCGNYLDYIPDVSHLSYSPELVFRINIHVFRKSDGTGIFQPSQEPDIVQMVQSMNNSIMDNLYPPEMPVSPPAVNLPTSKIRYELVDVYWHDSDTYYEWQPWDVCDDTDMFDTFGVNTDSEFNVFYYYNPNTTKQGCGPYPYVYMYGNAINFGWHDSQGLAHELGHVLDLPHTYIGCGDDQFDDTYHPDPARARLLP